jgi:hypothetical protein
VRVDHREAHAPVEVGERHVVEQRRLADARLAEEGDMLPPYRFPIEMVRPSLSLVPKWLPLMVGLRCANYTGASLFRPVPAWGRRRWEILRRGREKL